MHNTNGALPAELLLRIFCIVGVGSPKSVLNCLLTCKAWSTVVLSWREKCLLRYHFTVTLEFPMVLMVRISNVSHLDNIEVPAVNPALYKIWFRTYAAHLVSEFSWLTSMQRELLEQGQITAHIGQPVPKGDNDWKRLFQELGLLKDSFGYIRTYSDYHEDVDTGSWDGETEGAMGCPLLLSPIAELENRSLDEEQLVGAVLTRLGVDERVHPYYFVQRVPFDDREQCSNLLHDFRVGLRFVDPVLDPVDYDAHEGWWLTQAEQLIAKCVAFGMEELIHISVRDPYNDLGTNDGWYGNFCHFALCKQKDANQRVLGWGHVLQSIVSVVL